MNLLIELSVKPMKKANFGDSFKRSEAVLTVHIERRDFREKKRGAICLPARSFVVSPSRFRTDNARQY